MTTDAPIEKTKNKPLREMIEADRQERIAAANAAIDAALKEHRCMITSRVIITGSQVVSEILITALD